MSSKVSDGQTPLQFTTDNAPKLSFSKGRSLSQVILSVAIPLITSAGAGLMAVIYVEPIKALLVKLQVNPLFIAGGFLLVGTILLFKQVYNAGKDTPVKQAMMKAFDQSYPLESDNLLKQGFPTLIDPKAGKIYRAQNGWKGEDCDIYPPLSTSDFIYIYETKIGEGGNKTIKIALNGDGKMTVASATDPEDPNFESVRIYDRVFNTWNACRDPKGGVVELYHRINVGPKQQPYQQIILQEACLGGDLFAAMNARVAEYEDSQKAQIGRGVFQALKLLHQKGLYHRDVKTENVMLHIRDDGTIIPRLGDPDQTHFKLEDPENTQDANIKKRNTMGTLRALPPEVFVGEIKDEEKIDVWGLGMILLTLYSPDRVGVLQRLVELEEAINNSQEESWQAKLIEGINLLIATRNESTSGQPYQECQNMHGVRRAYEDIIFGWSHLSKTSRQLKVLLKGFLNPEVSKRYTLEQANEAYEKYLQTLENN
jgi:serine/threonine protein kinase